MTCGVWAGFDKPRPIYRGAFSNEVALPVWANVMKATFATYRPVDFPPPKGLIKVELCTASGQLATDKCVETLEDKETGEKVQRRTTYFEICTEEQAPKLGCSVHSGAGAGSFVKAIAPGEIPRATLAMNVSTVQPVVMKAPTVLGNDPYNSMQSIQNAIAMKLLGGGVAPVISSANVPAAPAPVEGEPEIRRALPVQRIEQQPTIIDSTIKLDPPPPIDF